MKRHPIALFSRMVRLLCWGICLSWAAAPSPSAAGTAEIVTWWHEPKDKEALGLIIPSFEARGDRWWATDVPEDVVSQTFVVARIIAGKPPTAAQWVDGAALQRLMKAGMLNAISQPDWSSVLPPLVVRTLQTPAGYIGVPTGLRGRNWVWLNVALFKKAGITVGPDWPRNWNEFHDTARRLRDAGILPLAIGGDPWQHLFTLEMVVAGIGGLDFYRRAMIDLDDAALASQTMVTAFRELEELAEFAQIGVLADDGNKPIYMLGRGEAAMNIMGDWEKQRLEAVGMKMGQDFDCAPVPGTRDFSIVNIEMFVFPKSHAEDATAMQTSLADTVMDRRNQQATSLVRGMTPVRLDVPEAPFDKCTSHLMVNARRADGLTVGAVRSMPSPLADLAGGAVGTFLATHMTPEEGAGLFRRTISANR